MSAGWAYRISVVLLVLFAVGHTLGFSQASPTWRLDALLASPRATTFDADGFRRTLAAITAISWQRLFLIPIGFSAVITLALTLAAWLASRTPSADTTG